MIYMRSMYNIHFLEKGYYFFINMSITNAVAVTTRMILQQLNDLSQAIEG